MKSARKSVPAYARAGVDIDKKMSGLAAVKRMVLSTATGDVLSNTGLFGGLFRAPPAGHVLVASTDGVGTKLKVAAMAGRHDTVGRDLVNHCVNDILVQGARPLFFLDYVGTARFNGPVFKAVLKGLCLACRQNGCALLGGETAEMPGLYPPGEYDLVGTIVGAVEARKLITGQTIRPGDVLVGLPSTGLHTNGYSLARKIVFEQAGLKITDRFPGSRKSAGEILLAPHRSYLKPITALMKQVSVRGMAHITGGGLIENVPRVLPRGMLARIDRRAWRVPPLFRFLQEKGRVSSEEMYRVFNMGIGYLVMVRRADLAESLRVLRKWRAAPVVIGEVARGRRRVVLE